DAARCNWASDFSVYSAQLGHSTARRVLSNILTPGAGWPQALDHLGSGKQNAGKTPQTSQRSCGATPRPPGAMAALSAQRQEVVFVEMIDRLIFGSFHEAENGASADDDAVPARNFCQIVQEILNVLRSRLDDLDLHVCGSSCGPFVRTRDRRLRFNAAEEPNRRETGPALAPRFPCSAGWAPAGRRGRRISSSDSGRRALDRRGVRARRAERSRRGPGTRRSAR